MLISVVSEKTMKPIELEFSDFQVFIGESIRKVVEQFAPKYYPEILFFHEDGKRISIFLEDPELTSTMSRVDQEIGKNKIVITIMSYDCHLEINKFLNSKL